MVPNLHDTGEFPTGFTGLELLASTTVALVFGLVIGGLACAFSWHLAREARWQSLPQRPVNGGYRFGLAAQAMAPLVWERSSGRPQRGRHRQGRYPVDRLGTVETN
jgi:hypothetical protein